MSVTNRVTSRPRRSRLVPIIAGALGCLLALASCGGGGSSGDQAAEMSASECEAYPAKDIKYIVPFGAGGYDAWARFMAPYLEKYLGGDITIRVENQPGGGGLRGVNSLYNATPDGTTILIFDPSSTVAQQLAGNTEEGLDVREIRYVGAATSDREILFTGPDSSVASMDDLKALDTIKHASMEPNPREVLLYNEVLEHDVDYIMHEATPDAVLALRRGDADVSRASISSLKSFLEADEITPLLYWGTELPHESLLGLYDFETVENLVDLGAEDLAPAFEYRRTIAAPPGTPQCVVDALADALAQTLEDPEFVAEAEKASMIVIPYDAQNTQDYVASIYDVYSKFADELKSAFAGS